VAVDVKMLATMKTAVKKSEALVLVAAIAMKKAKTEKDKMKIKTAVKGAMHKVMEKLKTDVAELKEEAAAIAVEKKKPLKGVNAKESADSDVATAAAGEDAQTNESMKSETDESEKAEDTADKTDATEKAEDTAEKTDATEKDKDTDAKSDEDASSTYPEDGDKWIFKHKKPKAADAEGAAEDESSSADAKAAETPEKKDAAMEDFKPAQDDFMKKLKEDLLKLKKHFPAKSPAPETADTAVPDHAEKPPPADAAEKPSAKDSDLPKLDEDMKRYRDATSSPKLEEESAEMLQDERMEQLRQKFAAKMALLQHEHAGGAEDAEASMRGQLLNMQDSMMHGRAPDISALQGLLSNPMMQMAMKQVQEHPEIIKDALEHDPMLHSMVAKDPRVAEVMENPDTIRMMSDPAMIVQNLKQLKIPAGLPMPGLPMPGMPFPMPSEDGADKSDALGKLMAQLQASHLRKD
jgi:hypothetical protein